MTADISIDWQRVALNLRSHGIQLQAASRRLGKHAGWLGQMARDEIGRSVEFHAGLRLLTYHLDVCGLAAHEALLNGQRTHRMRALQASHVAARASAGRVDRPAAGVRRWAVPQED